MAEKVYSLPAALQNEFSESLYNAMFKFVAFVVTVSLPLPTSPRWEEEEVNDCQFKTVQSTASRFGASTIVSTIVILKNTIELILEEYGFGIFSRCENAYFLRHQENIIIRNKLNFIYEQS